MVPFIWWFSGALQTFIKQGFLLGVGSVCLPISYKGIITEKLVLIIKMLIHLAHGLWDLQVCVQQRWATCLVKRGASLKKCWLVHNHALKTVICCECPMSFSAPSLLPHHCCLLIYFFANDTLKWKLLASHQCWTGLKTTFFPLFKGQPGRRARISL